MGRPTPCHFMTVASTLYASRPLAEPLVGAAITLENPSHNPRFITRLSPARVIKITNNQQFQHVKLAFISYGRVKNRHSSSIASAVVDAKCPCPLRGGGEGPFHRSFEPKAHCQRGSTCGGSFAGLRHACNNNYTDETASTAIELMGSSNLITPHPMICRS